MYRIIHIVLSEFNMLCFFLEHFIFQIDKDKNVCNTLVERLLARIHDDHRERGSVQPLQYLGRSHLRAWVPGSHNKGKRNKQLGGQGKKAERKGKV